MIYSIVCLYDPFVYLFDNERLRPALEEIVAAAGVPSEAATPTDPLSAVETRLKDFLSTYAVRPGKPDAAWPVIKKEDLRRDDGLFTCPGAVLYQAWPPIADEATAADLTAAVRQYLGKLPYSSKGNAVSRLVLLGTYRSLSEAVGP